MRLKILQQVRLPSGTLHEVGDEIELEGYVAEELIRDGVAVVIEAAPAAAVAAESESASEPDDTIDTGDDTINATAAAEALAKESDIDLSALQGSGKDGLITKADVAAAVKAKEASQE